MSFELNPLGTVRCRLGALGVVSTPFPEKLLATEALQELGREAIYRAWEIARLVSMATPTEREATVSLLLATMAEMARGSTRLGIGSLEGVLRELGVEDEQVETVLRLLDGGDLAEILGGPDDYKPLIGEGDYLYHQRAFRQEKRVANGLRERLRDKTTVFAFDRIVDALDGILGHRAILRGRPMQLSAEQQVAVRTALTRRITTISGGPGSGKTFVLADILRVLARMDVPMRRVALAAPTGKAAKRVEEALVDLLRAVENPGSADRRLMDEAPEPKTIHRLLGYSPRTGRYRHDERNLLQKDFVLIDEASMIGLELMDRLLSALKPGAHLVLLGDADQIPSVEGGSVFHDIRRPKHHVELKTSHRMDQGAAGGRSLLTVATLAKKGSVDDLFSESGIASRSKCEEVRFEGVELLEGDHPRFYEQWLEEKLRNPPFLELAAAPLSCPFEQLDIDVLEDLFARVGSYQILCVRNRDARRINSRHRIGELGVPVMMRRNDYRRELYNGEQGLLLDVGVVFARRERFVAFHPTELGTDIEVSYAITVHKSQGSEYDHVALVLPEPPHRLLTRELLYTALTRARLSVTILGSREAIVSAVGRSAERSSGLADRLA